MSAFFLPFLRELRRTFKQLDAEVYAFKVVALLYLASHLSDFIYASNIRPSLKVKSLAITGMG